MNKNNGVFFPIVEPVFFGDKELMNLECRLYGIPRPGCFNLSGQLPCYRLWSNDRKTVREFICKELLGVGGIERVVLPNVTGSNGIICDAMDFRTTESYPLKICDQQPSGLSGCDGVIITEGQAVAIATGDCYTVVVTGLDLKKVIVIHVSKKTLLGDNPVVLKNPHESPVCKAIHKLVECGHGLRHIKVKAILGIAGKNFVHPLDHPEYGLQNQRLISSLRSYYGPQSVTENNGIDLFQIIKAQAVVLGVLRENVIHDGRNTAEDKDFDGRLWHSQHYQSLFGGSGRHLVVIPNRLIR